MEVFWLKVGLQSNKKTGIGEPVPMLDVVSISKLKYELDQL